MPGVSSERFARMAFAKESAWKTPGTYRNRAGLHNLAPSFGQEAVENEEHWNGYGDRRPPTPGWQTGEASWSYYVHAATQSDLDELLTGALGEKSAGGALTFDAGGTNDETHVSVSAGTPRALVVVTGDDGIDYICPVVTFAANVATLGQSLPAGVTPTNVRNFSALSGALYNYLLGTSADTFSVELDWSGRGSTEIVTLAKGGGITGMGLRFERGQRLALDFSMRFAEYTESAGPSSNISNPSPWSTPFLSFLGDFYLSAAAGTPQYGTTAVTRLKRLGYQFAVPLLDETGSVGLNGDGSLPGSDILGYTREPGGQDLLEMLLTYPDDGWLDVWEDQTECRLFGVMFPGTRQGASAPTKQRISTWHPSMYLAARPEIVVDGGHRCQRLLWQVGRSLTATAASNYHLGFCTLP
jgi:hypothetical protein